MNTQTATPTANTLESFIKLNLSSKIFETAYSSDRDLILNLIYDKSIGDDFNGVEFLERFRATSIKELALRNHKIAEDLNLERMKRTEPTTGDVLIDDLGNKFYLARIYDNHFQYVKCGSFWMGSSGSGSFSGGYAFNGVKDGKEIGSFDRADLEEVQDQNEHRMFWFFMDERSGAHRGIYFNSNVRVWKFKQQ